ncbi:small subunit ribosomal protein S15 [Microdochium nivale]|nr:small subunit ribosomal protein S15 [Microdochium nivale]
MPPRINGVQRLSAFQLCMRPAIMPAATPSHTQTASLTTEEKRRIRKQEPHKWALMQQRKQAHNDIKEKIAAARKATWGDPVRGVTTPFIESLPTAGQASSSVSATDMLGNAVGETHVLPTSPHILNNMLYKAEVETAIQNAYALSKPVASFLGASVDPAKIEQDHRKHEENHKRAAEAIRRITSLDHASAKDRQHANIRRCVETFGRHNTDTTLRPKPLSRGQPDAEKPIRGGIDTGSSEVQIAILTTKIQALASELEQNRGYKDKMNKRNLRLLAHRRQRLLRYMERKERGSDRWRHMLETLGLTPASWKEQITL